MAAGAGEGRRDPRYGGQKWRVTALSAVPGQWWCDERVMLQLGCTLVAVLHAAFAGHNNIRYGTPC